MILGLGFLLLIRLRTINLLSSVLDVSEIQPRNLGKDCDVHVELSEVEETSVVQESDSVEEEETSVIVEVESVVQEEKSDVHKEVRQEEDESLEERKLDDEEDDFVVQKKHWQGMLILRNTGKKSYGFNSRKRLKFKLGLFELLVSQLSTSQKKSKTVEIRNKIFKDRNINEEISNGYDLIGTQLGKPSVITCFKSQMSLFFRERSIVECHNGSINIDQTHSGRIHQSPRSKSTLLRWIQWRR